MSNDSLQTSDIQGIIVSGYGHLYFSCYLFLQIEDAVKAREWLAVLAEKTTTANWNGDSDAAATKPEFAVNIAFTAPGLAAVALPEESLNTFPQEFREGIAERSRSRRLGDNGASSPTNWDIGGVTSNGLPQERVHGLLILQASSKEVLSQHRAEHEKQLERYRIAVIRLEEGHRLPDHTEHFGFRDSISQPEIEGSPKKPADGQLPIKAGEFMLGYRNSYGHLPPTPTVPTSCDVNKHLQPIPYGTGNGSGVDLRDLGSNGSYLVFRKLHQDVALFRRFFLERFPDSDERALMVAKAVGRWPSGAPLALAPDHDDPTLTQLPKSNDFGYTETDPRGYGCPIGSHVRRANPRDSLAGTAEESLTNVNRHRILRRGASYGEPLSEGQTEDDGQPRGLLFLCINADIKRQFELLQQTWINNPKFHALYGDRDPMVGDNMESGEKDRGPCNMTIQRQPVRIRVKQLPRFVTVKGGGYFFLPSIAALRFLASLH